MTTGEFQINNLPLIIISIAIVALGVLGFLEFKKLYVKLNMISTKIDEINDNLNQGPKEIHSNQIPPPHIQQQMMMRRQEEMKKMQGHMHMQGQTQGHMPTQHLQSEYKVNVNKLSEEIVNDEKQSINNDTDETDDKDESIISDSQSITDNDIKINIDDIDDIDDIHDIDDDNDDDNNDEDDKQSIMTIELDNKFKHLSIKELKDLCKENNLPISGNKSALISRLLENDE